MQLKDGIPKERIFEVLDWYGKNFKNKYTPESWSARTFRKRFPNIETSMIIHLQKSPKNIEIEPKAHDINRLLNLTWPKGIEEKDVLTTIQISINNYRELREIHKKIVDKMDTKSTTTICLFTRELSRSYPQLYSFIEEWMTKLHKFLLWASNPKNITHYAFKIDDEKFQAMGRTWSADYTGSTKSWSKYMEKVNENRKQD
jgi:hypothetical protein